MFKIYPVILSTFLSPFLPSSLRSLQFHMSNLSTLLHSRFLGFPPLLTPSQSPETFSPCLQWPAEGQFPRTTSNLHSIWLVCSTWWGCLQGSELGLCFHWVLSFLMVVLGFCPQLLSLDTHFPVYSLTTYYPHSWPTAGFWSCCVLDSRAALLSTDLPFPKWVLHKCLILNPSRWAPFLLPY
jgi:hypothetical protein